MKSQDLMSAYMDACLENDKRPASVYKFCKENKIEEVEFYKHFGSFEHLRSDVYSYFFDQSLELLEKSEEYQAYDAKNKLLSFYYTFFENLSANRSYVLFDLDGGKNLKEMKVMQNLRRSFEKYIKSLGIDTVDVKQKSIQDFQDKAISGGALMQLFMTLQFWIKDGSRGFEKTDLFIEKAVNLSFELMQASTVNSIIDFGKFMVKEMKGL